MVTSPDLISSGFSITTKTTSLRIIVLVIVFFGLLMLNSYSAVLVSRLAVERVNLPFPTLDSVSDQKTHVLCVRETSYAFHLFKVPYDPIPPFHVAQRGKFYIFYHAGERNQHRTTPHVETDCKSASMR